MIFFDLLTEFRALVSIHVIYQKDEHQQLLESV